MSVCRRWFIYVILHMSVFSSTISFLSLYNTNHSQCDIYPSLNTPKRCPSIWMLIIRTITNFSAKMYYSVQPWFNWALKLLFQRVVCVFCIRGSGRGLRLKRRRLRCLLAIKSFIRFARIILNLCLFLIRTFIHLWREKFSFDGLYLFGIEEKKNDHGFAFVNVLWLVQLSVSRYNNRT